MEKLVPDIEDFRGIGLSALFGGLMFMFVTYRDLNEEDRAQLQALMEHLNKTPAPILLMAIASLSLLLGYWIVKASSDEAGVPVQATARQFLQMLHELDRALEAPEV